MTNDRIPDGALDEALAQWGRHDAGDNDAIARIVGHADAITASPRATQPAKPTSAGDRPGSGRRWVSFAMGGGAIAASIAIALMVAPQPGGPAGSLDGSSGSMAPVMPGATTEQGAYELAAADREVDSFAMLFTLTAEEEQYL